MKEFSSCKSAIKYCLENKRFSVAHLYDEEKTMDMHIHDCFEIYYSVSGGKQFFIDDKYYDIDSGDVFLINNYETHYVMRADLAKLDRIVISVSPQYLQGISSASTDLTACFTKRDDAFCHRVHLTTEQRRQFVFLSNKITSVIGFGADIIENAAFAELMVMLIGLINSQNNSNTLSGNKITNEAILNVLNYINDNITKKISVATIAEHFYLSDSYLCRLFKKETGLTINKYITARRISIAKAKLSEGKNVGEACELSGFSDYANFINTFTRMVGLSPKRYQKCSNS